MKKRSVIEIMKKKALTQSPVGGYQRINHLASCENISWHHQRNKAAAHLENVVASNKLVAKKEIEINNTISVSLSQRNGSGEISSMAIFGSLSSTRKKHTTQ